MVFYMNTKICKKCGKEKSLLEFDKARSNKGGRRHTCKKCRHKLYYIPYNKKHYCRLWARRTINYHKLKGFIVNITIDELEQLAKKTEYCPICNNKLNWEYGSKKKYKVKNISPALDRKNNSNTLTLKNVWIICCRCNLTKQDRTLKEFIDYCRMAYIKLDAKIKTLGGFTL